MVHSLGAENWQLEEAEIDFITATTDRSKCCNPMYDFGRQLLEIEKGKGWDVRVSNFKGYKGTATSHLFVGRRADGEILRCSGSLASTVADDVITLAARVSRLDVQCTYLATRRPFNFADYIWRKSDAQSHKPGRRSKVTRHEQRGGGYTVEIGRRVSASLGRIYDRAGKDGVGELNRRWRAEVQLNKRACGDVAQDIRNGQFDHNTRRAFVAGWFSKRGYKLPETQPARSCVEQSYNVPAAVPSQIDDTTRRLRYVSRVCVPMLESICEAGETVKLARLLATIPTLREPLLEALQEQEKLCPFKS